MNDLTNINIITKKDREQFNNKKGNNYNNTKDNITNTEKKADLSYNLISHKCFIKPNYTSNYSKKTKVKNEVHLHKHKISTQHNFSILNTTPNSLLNSIEQCHNVIILLTKYIKAQEQIYAWQPARGR